MIESTLYLDLPSVAIRRIVVSAVANNIYLLTAKRTGSQILIDAADEAPAIAALLGAAANDAGVPAELKLIATTHSHWDHIRALAGLTRNIGVATAAGRDDAAAIEAEAGVVTDRLLDHGDVVNIDGIALKAVHLRGHTPGSIAYVLDATEETGTTVIFSGDSLFPGGVGNTEQDPERFTSLLNDVEQRLFAVYPDDAVVLPGHGEATTLGAERPALPEWRDRGW
ncbi:MAG: MBL fold metallo-hydrolase [Specibacter sp.]